jgi:anti-sigma factor RsiW
MRRLQMSHPDEGQLLRYADGESPADEISRTRRHLEACWQCRAALEELQNTVNGCVRYRNDVLGRYLPPPPAPWPDIYRGFARIDAALEQVGFFERALRLFRAPLRHVNRWAPVAAALIIACLLVYRFRQTPSVQAAELLRKAIAAADLRADKPRPIQIRTRDRRITRPAGATVKLALNAADAEAMRGIQARFQSVNYDWTDPLSARSYQAWRDRLAHKSDEVTEAPDAYKIRTRPASGALTSATLTIRRQDLRPVEERFEFGAGDWVEIAELPDAAPAAPALAEAGSPEIARRSAFRMPDKAPLAAPAAPATLGDELRVLAALNRVGADLGDPVEVSRSGSEILITGVGIPPQRQQEINDAVNRQPHVVVRFSDSSPARILPGSGAPVSTPPPAGMQPSQARLAERIGGPAYFAQLAAQVLDLTEPMMSRAYALRRLAERFPARVNAELTTADWRTLVRLQQEHTRGLRRQALEIDRLLKPALAPVSGPAAEPSPVNYSGPWQPAAEELFESARQVERTAAVLFGAADEAFDERVPARLLQNLAQLRARLDAYDRLAPEPLEQKIQ